ncbi:histidine kinase/DNA gyrase B/HSP90-like ATPase [Saccharopolyspora erythraea NRRL 2338]|uniref:ATPase n=2 Tax=Saccharopolyspora erythraea TaxID=1836 RepID=A4FA11_SACEN|nr:ATP-binding protein [Saccharopolyspora erythraea]EQD85665.1 histidine kinase [Saccharopolyspora erythraea D]PFG94671.1 histidine kinase/DNA gyrase B/HSP90-like ATPase [Saccharopolyspora erythraea NRRL 2338]QRK91401.1 ATP-binding protein [Saccharopolyspora erythraea]CAM00886.1 ATPase [Saccharopolyspora erythraea NRRL 2338]
MPGWAEDIPTVGTVPLSPDPRALESLGRNHSLATALSDLVDNSVDAGADHVLIRFIRHRGRICSLYVVDDGRGMSAAAIDNAMTIGGRRTYHERDLGHFGMGLQSASFSQARTLTVFSRAVGCEAVGRRLALHRRSDFHADMVPSDFAGHELGRDWSMNLARHGTVIRWDEVTGFPVTTDDARVEEFISEALRSVSGHLGLIFHRILAANRVTIHLDVEDVDTQQVGGRFEVSPLDPFGYRRTGRSGYPKEITATDFSTRLTFRCHIWPGRSAMPQFRLSSDPAHHQGLYIYRRERLIQAGGEWGGLAILGRRLQLARVEVDIDDDVSGLLRMNPEKSKVQAGPEFVRLVETARAADGTTFADYLETAEQAFRESRKRTRARRPMLPPGRGFTPALRRTLGAEVPFTDDDRPIEIRWRRFEDDDFFEVDRDNRTLWLNDLYRSRVLGGRRGGLNDSPILKATLYLLVEEVFQGEYLGPRDKDNINLWQEVLTAAAKSEKE